MDTKDTARKMKIDPARIRAMRVEKGWSQENLAALAGVSVRTIQRIETRGVISLESRMALASAFGIDVKALSLQARPQTQVPAKAPAPEPAPDYATGMARAPAAGRARMRPWGMYMLVCGGLVAIDLYPHSGVSWSMYPLAVWGSVLLLRSLFPRRNETGNL